MATGELTVKGVTREVELAVELLGVGTDPYGNERVGLEATGQISRKDFGIDFNIPLEGGKLLIGDAVTISLTVQAVRQAARQPDPTPLPMIRAVRPAYCADDRLSEAVRTAARAPSPCPGRRRRTW